jgi:NAD(P)-dependent dehydrogenase (short-subunit alcohol dehydrogenase family)
VVILAGDDQHRAAVGAKAALNMMTRTAATDYHDDGI